MLVGDDPSLVSDVVKDVLRRVMRLYGGQASNGRYLETTLAQKLIASSEGELDDTCEFGQLFRSVCFDIGNALRL
jgi:hypothetical protein